MTRPFRTGRVAVGGAVALAAAIAVAAPSAAAGEPADPSLHETVAALDAAVFDAFNRCDEPGQLDVHAGYFDADVEFYHDNGGVTWTRDAMIANTAQYVCGNFRRELVPGTLDVFPVRDFGAVSRGTHRFCGIADGGCDGEADFVIVWREQEGAWRITRVLSVGHRAAVAP